MRKLMPFNRIDSTFNRIKAFLPQDADSIPDEEMEATCSSRPHPFQNLQGHPVQDPLGSQALKPSPRQYTNSLVQPAGLYQKGHIQ